MIERNEKSLVTVYRRAEEIFQLLSKEKDQFSDWVALGSINIEVFVEENLRDADDYDVACFLPCV